MEAAAAARMTTYSRYGSSTFKQVYIYGGLDPGKTELRRTFGLSWSVATHKEDLTKAEMERRQEAFFAEMAEKVS